MFLSSAFPALDFFFGGFSLAQCLWSCSLSSNTLPQWSNAFNSRPWRRGNYHRNPSSGWGGRNTDMHLSWTKWGHLAFSLQCVDATGASSRRRASIKQPHMKVAKDHHRTTPISSAGFISANSFSCLLKLPLFLYWTVLSSFNSLLQSPSKLTSNLSSICHCSVLLF